VFRKRVSYLTFAFEFQEKDLIRLQREAKKLQTIQPKKLEANNRLLFVIRIRGYALILFIAVASGSLMLLGPGVGLSL
jgi:hypothetical protein